MAALLPANPGEGLWIGGAGGKNHYNVGIGLGTSGGQNHEDFGQDLIEEGFVYSIAGGTAPYNDADKFYLNATGNPVFRINAGAGRTSTNTAHPRSELRELLANGTTKAAWDGRSGVHYVRARYRINDVSANRPWVCFTQIHGSEISPETSDLVRVQCEGANGTTTGLSIVCRRSPPAGGGEITTTLRTGYDVGDWFTCELGMYDGRLRIFLDGVMVLDVANMGQVGNYFKTGCYMQDNVEKGSTANDFAEVEIERGSLVTWHSGYPNPTLPIFTGATDPDGGPGGGDGGPDTQAPTVPQDLVSLQDDEQITLIWSPSTDNVGVDHYNVYRFSDTGTGGGTGSTATVGKTTGGTSTTSSSTDKMAASRHTADADGTLTTGFFRARLSASGSTTSKMFVYADSSGAPGALLATSGQITIDQTVETIQEYPFTGGAQISIVDGTSYWIAAAWDDPGSPSITYSRDATASGRVEQTLTYPTAPDPFGTPTGTFTGPIDAWIETVSTGTGGGTDTTLGKTSNGASSSTSSTDKMAVSTATSTGAGTLTSGVARVWLSTAGSTGTRMVVCADSAGAPGNVLAVSDQVTLTATAEAAVSYTFTGSNQIAIANATAYWVGVAWDDPGTPSITFSRDGTAASRQETTTFTYPPTVGAAFGTPDPLTGPIDAYVNVTAGAGYVLLATTTLATYTDTGLTNGTEYTYVVSASDAAGNSSGQSLSVSDTPGPPDTTAPSVPADLVAVAGDRKVTLTWTASTDADSGVDHYNVYRDSVQIREVDADEPTSYVDVNAVNGTLYSYTVSAVDVAGNESAQSTADTATPAAPAIAGAPWLIHELGADAKLGIEIAWGAVLGNDADTWTWTDVTDDVRHDPGISTSLGRNDESSTSNPAALSLVLDNTTGDYSLGGHSANWPNVRRNTPVRVRIDPDDGGGGRVVFFGFADGFTPGWARHNVPAVTLSASGTLRRIAQGDAPVASAYRRVMTATSSVMAYWPFEEGKDAEYAPAVRGGADMTIVTGTGFRGGPTGFGDPGWGDDDSFDCSAPLPTLKTGAFEAAVYPYPDTGSQQVRFLFSVPEDGLPDGTTIIHIHAGTCRWGITYEINALGESALGVFRMVNGAEHSNTIIGFDVNGRSGRLTLQLTQNGADIDWRLDYLDAAADRGGTSSTIVGGGFSDTLTGVTGGIVSLIEVNPHGHIGDMGFGHLTVEDELNSLFTDSRALFAHRREQPTSVGGRLDRLGAENGIPFTVHGSAVVESGTIFSKMGSQLVAPLLTLLGECETFDQGQLWDGLAAGLSYTTRRRREDGTVRLTVDASAGQLVEGFDAVDDDQRTRNRVVVSRLFGVTSMAEDVDGPLGTEAIGVYDTSYQVNANAEAMALQHAQWAVHLGTVAGYRYPSVTLNLRKAPSLAAAVLDIIPGERIDVTNLDDALDQFPGGTVSLIVEGIGHEISASSWLVTFRCSPFSPWGVGRVAAETGDTSDLLMRPDTDGSTLDAAASAGATSISVATAAGAALWSTVADDYPLSLSVGGLFVRATACSGASSPQTFTVAALTHARADEVEVKLWDPRPVGLG